MSKCTRDRWGKGCTPDRPQTTEQAKEIEVKFKKMLADRNAQNAYFEKKEEQVLEQSVTVHIPKGRGRGGGGIGPSGL